jgi:hypothetical protein
MQKRTTNIFLAVRFFSPCIFEKNARQITSLSCTRNNVHDKHSGARQIWSFP